MGIEPTPAVVVVFCAHATHTMRYFPILFFGCWVMCCCCMDEGGGDTLCTIPNPSHEKLRKQNALFLFFYGVPLPPPKGTKGQGQKTLDPGTGKDIIAYGRAEPSGLHPCHGKRNCVVSKEKGIANEERRITADGNILAMVCGMAVRRLRKGC